MTALELETRLLERLGEDPNNPKFYTAGEALAWLNAAQRIMVLLTLCLERTATLPLTANTAFYSMLSVYSDWLLPLRIRTAAGAKVTPGRYSDLAALDASWSKSPGTVVRYAMAGFDLLGIYQQPTGSSSLSVTFARCPAALVNASDVPEVPAIYHPALIKGAIPLLRAKEGGKEWQKVLPLWDDFLDGCQELGDHVRARNKEQGYDNYPVELARFDRSTLMEMANAQ